MGVYVEWYRFSTFIVTDSVYYKYQYSKTYTLCSGLNRLQVYVTEIKEKQIFQRIRWQTWALFECVFYKFAVPVVGCLTVAAGILARSEGGFQRNRHGSAICKKRSQKCGVAIGFFEIFVFLLFLSHTCKPTLQIDTFFAYKFMLWLKISVFCSHKIYRIKMEGSSCLTFSRN